jgi:hypothetical protein
MVYLQETKMPTRLPVLGRSWILFDTDGSIRMQAVNQRFSQGFEKTTKSSGKKSLSSYTQTDSVLPGLLTRLGKALKPYAEMISQQAAANAKQELTNELPVQSAQPLQQQKSPIAPTMPTHSSDFTSVDWFGTEYTFALGIRSSVIKVLWEEWQRSGHGLHQQTIRDLVDAERDNFRMDTAFRNHPALGSMIQKCGDGRYKLVAPADINSNRRTNTKTPNSLRISSSARQKRA